MAVAIAPDVELAGAIRVAREHAAIAIGAERGEVGAARGDEPGAQRGSVERRRDGRGGGRSREVRGCAIRERTGPEPGDESADQDEAKHDESSTTRALQARGAAWRRRRCLCVST